uniref:Putative secreted peptide n=1 Tax=Anopheles braziliensis TaxID=58242 RepID=A0A2M3ZR33_9DIPT
MVLVVMVLVLLELLLIRRRYNATIVHVVAVVGHQLAIAQASSIGKMMLLLLLVLVDHVQHVVLVYHKIVWRMRRGGGYVCWDHYDRLLACGGTTVVLQFVQLNR